MNIRTARVISYLLHPMVYPLLGTLIILQILPYYTGVGTLALSLALVFTGTYIIPAAISFLLHRIQLIPSLEMTEARDRRWPYLIGAICYYFTARYINALELPKEVYAFLLSSALIIVLHLALLFYFKPSAHLAGIGGFTGLLLAVSLKYQIGFLPFIALCFLLAGLLGSARLRLGAHTPFELAAGYVSGLVIVSVLVFYL